MYKIARLLHLYRVNICSFNSPGEVLFAVERGLVRHGGYLRGRLRRRGGGPQAGENDPAGGVLTETPARVVRGAALLIRERFGIYVKANF